MVSCLGVSAVEGFLEGLGVIAFVLLTMTGLAVGALVAKLSGRAVGLYALIGGVAAIATPFLLAAIGVTVAAAGSVFLLLVVGAVGAAVVAGIVRALSKKV